MFSAVTCGVSSRLASPTKSDLSWSKISSTLVIIRTICRRGSYTDPLVSTRRTIWSRRKSMSSNCSFCSPERTLPLNSSISRRRIRSMPPPNRFIIASFLVVFRWNPSCVHFISRWSISPVAKIDATISSTNPFSPSGTKRIASSTSFSVASSRPIPKRSLSR